MEEELQEAVEGEVAHSVVLQEVEEAVGVILQVVGEAQGLRSPRPLYRLYQVSLADRQG